MRSPSTSTRAVFLPRLPDSRAPGSSSRRDTRVTAIRTRSLSPGAASPLAETPWAAPDSVLEELADPGSKPRHHVFSVEFFRAGVDPGGEPRPVCAYTLIQGIDDPHEARAGSQVVR